MAKRRRLKSHIVEYIDTIKVLSFHEMVSLTVKKHNELVIVIKEMKEFGVNSLEFQEMLRFYTDIRALRYFLEHQEKPENVHPKSFTKFRWIAEILVTKGEMPSKILTLFPED
jgi:hypothetical protein